MRLTVKQSLIVIFFMFLCLITTNARADEEEECDEFVIDPQHPDFCHGNGNPDTAPVDSHVYVLIVVSGFLVVHQLSSRLNKPGYL